MASQLELLDRALPIEGQLWTAASMLRGRVAASDYRQILLTLLFLRAIGDSRSSHSLVIPEAGRWSRLQKSGRTGRLGELLDGALKAISDANPGWGLEFKNGAFSASGVSDDRLGELLSIFSDLEVRDTDAGDLFGKVHEYFLSRFALEEGQRGGEFYTPHSIVELLVSLVGPISGVLYDPCCGAGGMFVSAHQSDGGTGAQTRIVGQEANPRTWQIAKMNLASRGIAHDLGARAADTFAEDLHPDLSADFVLANPPFNMSDWGHSNLSRDPRFERGMPPPGNANMAWVQHILHHLSVSGAAGIVLANGSLSSTSSGEADIRRRLVKDDLVDAIVRLPEKLFYSTQIPVSLWILTKGKRGSYGRRARHGRFLFIDARRMGHLVSRTLRVLDRSEMDRIVHAYHSFRDRASGQKALCQGFSKVVPIGEVERHRYALVPGRYVGFAEDERPKPFRSLDDLHAEMDEPIAGQEMELVRALRRIKGLRGG